EAGHPSQLGDARRVLAVLVAGKRAAAEERDSARRRAERARRDDRAGAPLARNSYDAAGDTARRRRLVGLGAARAIVGEPGAGGRGGRARPHPGRARSRRRKHLGNRPLAGADAPRPVPENPAAGARYAVRRRGLALNRTRDYWIPNSQFPGSVTTK